MQMKIAQIRVKYQAVLRKSVSGPTLLRIIGIKGEPVVGVGSFL
jgi:hypothetical protein